MADPNDDGEDIENDGDDTKNSAPNEFPDWKSCAAIGAERDSPAELAFAGTKSDPIECRCETRDQQCREHALPSRTAGRQRRQGAAEDEYQTRGNRYEPFTRERVRRMNRSADRGGCRTSTTQRNR
jgi:hypothetical protein